MAEVVYILCAATSVACAFLLWRGYMKSRTQLLFWGSLCFLGLALNNVGLVLDLVVFPSVDLSIARSVAALAGMSVLVFGLIWEER